MVGGNKTAIIQIKTVTKNAIGEAVSTWVPEQTVKGWLDYSSGEYKSNNYHVKTPECSHVFISDYVSMNSAIKPSNSRMVIDGKIFEIVLIDNPMELNEHLELMLNYVGVFNG